MKSHAGLGPASVASWNSKLARTALMAVARLERLFWRAALAPFVGRRPLGQLRDWALKAQRSVLAADKKIDQARFERWVERSGFPQPGWTQPKRCGFDFDALNFKIDGSQPAHAILGRCLESPVAPWMDAEGEILVALRAKARLLAGYARENPSTRWVASLGAQGTLDLIPPGAQRCKDDFRRALADVMPGWHLWEPISAREPATPQEHLARSLARISSTQECLERARIEESAHVQRKELAAAIKEPTASSPTALCSLLPETSDCALDGAPARQPRSARL
jgi:hypothetical protein